MAEDKKLPKPSEPKDAGSKEPRTQPPIWPGDYDTAEQPNQPEELKAEVKRTAEAHEEDGEVEPRRRSKKDK